jgi:hypothetical protein
MSDEFPIDEHGKNKAAGRQSHHLESQTALKKAVAGYNANKDKTVSLPTKDHQKTFKGQKAIMSKPNHAKDLGRSESIRDAAKLAQQAGVPEGTAGQAAMGHDGYLKGTTPLDKVKGVLAKFNAAQKSSGAKQSKEAPSSKGKVTSSSLRASRPAIKDGTKPPPAKPAPSKPVTSQSLRVTSKAAQSSIDRIRSVSSAKGRAVAAPVKAPISRSFQSQTPKNVGGGGEPGH